MRSGFCFIIFQKRLDPVNKICYNEYIRKFSYFIKYIIMADKTRAKIIAVRNNKSGNTISFTVVITGLGDGVISKNPKGSDNSLYKPDLGE